LWPRLCLSRPGRSCADALFTPRDCTARRTHTSSTMVLLIGNYSPDQQQSMQRFSAMMLQGLSASGVSAELVRPEPVLGNVKWMGPSLAKWLGYVDKYILFPFQLRKRLASGPDLV